MKLSKLVEGVSRFFVISVWLRPQADNRNYTVAVPATAKKNTAPMTTEGIKVPPSNSSCAAFFFVMGTQRRGGRTAQPPDTARRRLRAAVLVARHFATLRSASQP